MSNVKTIFQPVAHKCYAGATLKVMTPIMNRIWKRMNHNQHKLRELFKATMNRKKIVKGNTMQNRPIISEENAIKNRPNIFVEEVSKNSGSVKASANSMTSKAMRSVLPSLWKLSGNSYNFIRLAGASGASAVILGAVGSHSLDEEKDKEARKIFDTANRFHFFHSLALMTVPMCKRPALTGSLFVLGTFVFSGILYYRAFTGNKRFSRYAPFGGSCLILAWLSLLL